MLHYRHFGYHDYRCHSDISGATLRAGDWSITQILCRCEVVRRFTIGRQFKSKGALAAGSLTSLGDKNIKPMLSENGIVNRIHYTISIKVLSQQDFLFTPLVYK